MFDEFQKRFAEGLQELGTIIWNIIVVPFKLWNSLPEPVHYLAWGIVVIVAIFFAWVTWKLRFEWQNRAS